MTKSFISQRATYAGTLADSASLASPPLLSSTCRPQTDCSDCRQAAGISKTLFCFGGGGGSDKAEGGRRKAAVSTVSEGRTRLRAGFIKALTNTFSSADSVEKDGHPQQW